MKTKIQTMINVSGLMLLGIGSVLLVFALTLEAVKFNLPTSEFLNRLFILGDIALPFSVVFIAGGLILFSMEIIPSGKEHVPLEVLKIRYVLGEITKQQYDLMTKEVEAFHKIMS